jgi:hypothetical protein
MPSTFFIQRCIGHTFIFCNKKNLFLQLRILFPIHSTPKQHLQARASWNRPNSYSHELCAHPPLPIAMYSAHRHPIFQTPTSHSNLYQLSVRPLGLLLNFAIRSYSFDCKQLTWLIFCPYPLIMGIKITHFLTGNPLAKTWKFIRTKNEISSDWIGLWSKFKKPCFCQWALQGKIPCIIHFELPFFSWST